MNCARCDGLMINEWFQDILDDTGEINFWGLHCLLCGEILDPIILANREALSVSGSRN